MTIRKLTPTEIHMLCAAGPLDQRTIRHFIAGKLVKPISVHRIRAAAAALNLTNCFDPALFEKVLGPAADPERAAPVAAPGLRRAQ